MQIFGSYQNKSYEWVIRTLQKFFERKVFYTFVDTANWKKKFLLQELCRAIVSLT